MFDRILPIGTPVQSTHPHANIDCRGTIVGRETTARGWDLYIIRWDGEVPDPNQVRYTPGWIKEIGER